MKYEFIRAHSGQFRIGTMCRLLDVSRSGYYAWLSKAQGRELRAVSSPSDSGDARDRRDATC